MPGSLALEPGSTGASAGQLGGTPAAGRALLVTLLILLLPALAAAGGPPARVWIDGEDIDGPPPGPVHIPTQVGVSVMMAEVGTRIRTSGRPEPVARGDTEDRTAMALFLNGRRGPFRGEIELLYPDFTLASGVPFGDLAFPAGSSLTQRDVVGRLHYDVCDRDTPWGRYRFAAGLRVTVATRLLTAGSSQALASDTYMTPELAFAGRWHTSEVCDFHSKLSYANNYSGGRGQEAIEAQAYISRHVLATGCLLHDVQLGFRFLSDRLTFTDLRGVQTTFHTTHLGLEAGYTVKF